MSNRTRGDAFERACRHQLEDHGWLVLRAGGSLGRVDLVALPEASSPHPRPWLVQCKLNGRLDPTPWNELLELAWHHNATPVLALKVSPGRIGWHQLVTLKRPRIRSSGAAELLHPGATGVRQLGGPR